MYPLQLAELDTVGGFQLCPCPSSPRWLLPQDCKSGDSDPTQHQPQGGAWSMSPPRHREQQPHATQSSPGDSQNLNYWEKSCPLSHEPLGTKLREGCFCRSGIWGWSPSKESSRQMKETGCQLFSFAHLPPAMPEASPSPDLLLGATAICKQYHRDKYRGPWGWGWNTQGRQVREGGEKRGSDWREGLQA